MAAPAELTHFPGELATGDAFVYVGPVLRLAFLFPRHHFPFSFLPALGSLSAIEYKSDDWAPCRNGHHNTMVVTPIKNRRERHPQESTSTTATYCIIERAFEYYEDYPSSTKRISLTAPFSMAIFASCRFEPPRGRVTEPGHSTTSAGAAAEPRSNSGTWVCP